MASVLTFVIAVATGAVAALVNTELTTLLQSQVWKALSRASQGDSIDVASVVSSLRTDLRAAATGHSP